MLTNKITMTGSLPPPIGGVTIFLKYFIQAVDSIEELDVTFFSFKNILSFDKRFLIINSSNKYKRLLYLIIGRIFFKKVVFIKHGGLLDLNSHIVLFSIKISDGVICLNDNVKEQLVNLNVKELKLSTVFLENVAFISGSDCAIKKNKMNEPPKLLYYINNDSEVLGKSTYGVDFILDCLPHIDKYFSLEVIDLSGVYEKDFSSFCNVAYYKEPQDFRNMLSNCDVYLRPTRSDGMSVALLEAGILNVKCLASDVVERPEHVYTYISDDKSSFLKSLHHITRSLDLNSYSNVSLNSIRDVYAFLNKL